MACCGQPWWAKREGKVQGRLGARMPLAAAAAAAAYLSALPASQSACCGRSPSPTLSLHTECAPGGPPLQLRASLIGSSAGDGQLRCVFILPEGVSLGGQPQPCLTSHLCHRRYTTMQCMHIWAGGHPGSHLSEISLPACPVAGCLHACLSRSITPSLRTGAPAAPQLHATLQTAEDIERYLADALPSLPEAAIKVPSVPLPPCNHSLLPLWLLPAISLFCSPKPACCACPQRLSSDWHLLSLGHVPLLPPLLLVAPAARRSPAGSGAHFKRRYHRPLLQAVQPAGGAGGRRRPQRVPSPGPGGQLSAGGRCHACHGAARREGRGGEGSGMWHVSCGRLCLPLINDACLEARAVQH